MPPEFRVDVERLFARIGAQEIKTEILQEELTATRARETVFAAKLVELDQDPDKVLAEAANPPASSDDD